MGGVAEVWLEEGSWRRRGRVEGCGWWLEGGCVDRGMCGWSVCQCGWMALRKLIYRLHKSPRNKPSQPLQTGTSFSGLDASHRREEDDGLPSSMVSQNDP